MATLIETAATEPVRALVSLPRQHGKTELFVHGFVWHALRDPTRTHAYITYSQERANEVSGKIVRALRAARVRANGTQKHIQIEGGGAIYCAGIDGALTGRGISGLAAVDDPHKNREEANSATIRDKVHAGYRAVVASGLHETGSVMVVHTRWHTDDLIARLTGEGGYDVINLPAIDTEGRPLWPELRSLALLESIRATIGEYEWGSLFMGAPRPIGSSVFRDVQYYDALPDKYRVGIGFDLAVTAKTSSDYAAAVVLAESEGTYYVLDVRRVHADVPTFAGQLRALAASYPGARMLWYASAQEIGTAALLRELGLRTVFAELAKHEKLVRAQPVAAAWNGTPATHGMKGRAPRVFLPRAAPWLSAFVSEVCGFTGAGDRHDDQVDALAAAFDVLERSNVVDLPKAFGTAFETFSPRAQRGTRFQW